MPPEPNRLYIGWRLSTGVDRGVHQVWHSPILILNGRQVGVPLTPRVERLDHGHRD